MNIRKSLAGRDACSTGPAVVVAAQRLRLSGQCVIKPRTSRRSQSVAQAPLPNATLLRRGSWQERALPFAVLCRLRSGGEDSVGGRHRTRSFTSDIQMCPPRRQRQSKSTLAMLSPLTLMHPGTPCFHQCGVAHKWTSDGGSIVHDSRASSLLSVDQYDCLPDNVDDTAIPVLWISSTVRSAV